jgi:DNA-binding NarL/FixJ family response regulator
MPRKSCLAGIDDDRVAMLSRVISGSGAPYPPSIERLVSVHALGVLAPDLLVCDVDRSEVDSLELLRRVRFVVPEGIIAVYTGRVKQSWALACHLAGASCLLAKESSEPELIFGLRFALRTGCYTDSRFAAA